LRSGEAAGTYGWRGAAYGWITTLTSDRIIVVAAENRFVVVPSETRWAGIVVAAENRFVVVPSEMRWAGVPKEERTVKAIESRIQVIV
jgi:hypothetical protein